jgi:hypothetical protein
LLVGVVNVAIFTPLPNGGWSIHWQGKTHSYVSATTILDGIQGFANKVEYNSTQCTRSMTAKKVVVVVDEIPYAELYMIVIGFCSNLKHNTAPFFLIGT